MFSVTNDWFIENKFSSEQSSKMKSVGNTLILFCPKCDKCKILLKFQTTAFKLVF